MDHAPEFVITGRRGSFPDEDLKNWIQTLIEGDLDILEIDRVLRGQNSWYASLSWVNRSAMLGHALELWCERLRCGELSFEERKALGRIWEELVKVLRESRS